MHALALILSAADPTAPTTPDGSALGRAAALTLIVALIGVVAVFGLWLWMVLDRNRRERTEADQRRLGKTEHEDAWAEAGRRAEGETVDLNPDELGY